MKKITLLTVLAGILLVGAYSPASPLITEKAHAQESISQEQVNSEALAVLIGRLYELQQILKDIRQEKALAVIENGNEEISAEILKENEEYFFIKPTDTGDILVFAEEEKELQYYADSGVEEVRLSLRCLEGTEDLVVNNNSACGKIVSSTEHQHVNGSRRFSFDMRFIEEAKDQEALVTVTACYEWGCEDYRRDVIVHKSVKTFADSLVIGERYEWEYEYDNDMFHAQEIFLSFDASDIKKVKLRMYCDRGVRSARVWEDDRFSCNERRSYTVTDFGVVEVDDEGREMNLLLESVTKDFEPEDVGKVRIEFFFINKRNGVAYKTVFTPTQLDTLEAEKE